MAMQFALAPLVTSFVDAAVDPMAVVDRDLELVYFNAGYLRLAGLRRHALMQKPARGLCHAHFGLDSCNDKCVALRAFETGRPCRVDEVTSASLALHLIVVAIPLFGEAGAVQAVIEQYRDVTAESRMQVNYRHLLEQERAQKELLADEVARKTVELERANANLRLALGEVSRVARTDGLTGLANRRDFDERFEAHLLHAQNAELPLAFILFDIDHFKRVNDEQGHAAGDRVLQGFASVLSAASRHGDVVARVGGEEFGLVLPGTTENDARRVAVRVQEQLREQGIPVTTSAGVAVRPADGTTCKDLMRSADNALYAAKRAGRNRIVLAASVRGRVSQGLEVVASGGVVQNS